MKRYLFIFLLFPVLAWADCYSSVILLDDPCGFWRMDSPFDTSAGFECNQSHSSGSGFCNTKLDLVNSPTTGVTGIPGATPDVATSFNGSTQYVWDSGGAFNNCLSTPEGPASPCTNNVRHDFTVEGWIQPASLKTHQIVGRTTNGSGSFDWAMFAYNNNKFGCVMYDDQAGGTYATTPDSTATYVVSPLTWYLVSCTVTATSFKIQIWVNGVADSSSTTITGDGVCGPFGGLANLAIGAGNIGSPTTHFVDGKIDEVATYNRVLTSIQMGNHYTRGITAAACAGDWPFTVERERNPLLAPDGITSEDLRRDAFIALVTNPDICDERVLKPVFG